MTTIMYDSNKVNWHRTSLKLKKKRPTSFSNWWVIVCLLYMINGEILRNCACVEKIKMEQD